MEPKTFFDREKLLIKNPQKHFSRKKSKRKKKKLEFFSEKFVKILEEESDGKVS